MKNKIVVILVLTLVLSLSVSFTGCIEQTEGLDQYSTEDSWTFDYPIIQTYDPAQSFVPTVKELTRVELKLDIQGSPGYIRLFIRKNLYDVENKTLFRRWRQGERKIVGMADDYAFLIQGLIDLYEADFDPGWIEWAFELMDEQLKLFYDAENGGIFMTRKGHDQKIDLRIKEDSDSVIPSAGSVAVLNGLRLARFTDSKEYSVLVERTLKSSIARIRSQADSAPELLAALIMSQTKPVEVILVGDRNAADTRSMLKTVYSVYYPGKIVMLVDNKTTQDRLARYFPFIASVKEIDGKTTAYVCTDRTCKAPVTDPETVKSLLN